MTARFPSGDYDGFMPPKGTIGMALAAYKLWRRLPPSQKRLVLDQARRHGPKAAAAATALLKSKKKP